MRWIIVVAALVASPGCGWSSETEKWRRTAEDYKTQLETANTTLDKPEDFKEQSEKWQIQSKKLGAAMIDASSTLDPLEIRKIYLDNRDLTAVADQLEARIASAEPEDGDLMLTDAQLRFDVTGFKGRSVIRAYLDYESAPFLECELAVTEPVLPLPYNIATGFYDELFKADRVQASESENSFFPLNDDVKDEMTAKLADTHFSGAGARLISVTRIQSLPNLTLTSSEETSVRRGEYRSRFSWRTSSARRAGTKSAFSWSQRRRTGKFDSRLQKWQKRKMRKSLSIGNSMPKRHHFQTTFQNGLLDQVSSRRPKIRVGVIEFPPELLGYRWISNATFLVPLYLLVELATGMPTPVDQ